MLIEVHIEHDDIVVAPFHGKVVFVRHNEDHADALCQILAQVPSVDGIYRNVPIIPPEKAERSLLKSTLYPTTKNSPS